MSLKLNNLQINRILSTLKLIYWPPFLSFTFGFLGFRLFFLSDGITDDLFDDAGSFGVEFL